MTETTGEAAPMREPLLAALGAEAIKLQAASDAAVEAHRADTVATLEAIESRGAEDRKAFNRRNLTVLAAQLVAVVLLIVLGVWNRATLSEIRSCTNPTGTCAERGAHQQFVAIASLVYCNAHVPPAATPEQVSRCLASASATFGGDTTP